MSDTALHELDPKTSALEASNQVLGERFLRLVPDVSLPDEAYYPYSVEDKLPRATLHIAASATTETVELDSSETNTPPPLEFEPETVKEILRGDTGLDYQERLAALLSYAWHANNDEAPIPVESIEFAPNDLAEWYVQQAKTVDSIIELRSELPDLYDQTDPYNSTSPFIANASMIHDIAINRGMRKEGLIIEVSARLILLEALKAKSSS